MKRGALWRGWVGFTSRTEVGTSIAVFRILVGLCVVLTVGWVIAADLVHVLWVPPEHGGMSRIAPGRIVNALGGPTPAVMTGLSWLTCAMGLVLAGGFGGPIAGRAVAFVTLQLVMATVDINALAGGQLRRALAERALVVRPGAHHHHPVGLVSTEDQQLDE